MATISKRALLRQAGRVRKPARAHRHHLSQAQDKIQDPANSIGSFTSAGLGCPTWADTRAWVKICFRPLLNRRKPSTVILEHLQGLRTTTTSRMVAGTFPPPNNALQGTRQTRAPLNVSVGKRSVHIYSLEWR